MVDHRSLFHAAHSASILFAALLFLAGFLCVLLWTNNIVRTESSVADPYTSTFTYYSPTVSTFTITYGVAIFGTVWNSLLFVVLMILGRYNNLIKTDRLRYDVERAACMVTAIGNVLYAFACLALMATLARLAADAPGPTPGLDPDVKSLVQSAGGDRQAGQGVTAAMAGLAAASALWACVMDVLHPQYSQHYRAVKQEVIDGSEDPNKEA